MRPLSIMLMSRRMTQERPARKRRTAGEWRARPRPQTQHRRQRSAGAAERCDASPLQPAPPRQTVLVSHRYGARVSIPARASRPRSLLLLCDSGCRCGRWRTAAPGRTWERRFMRERAAGGWPAAREGASRAGDARRRSVVVRCRSDAYSAQGGRSGDEALFVVATSSS